MSHASLDWRYCRDPLLFLALGFGAGCMPRAPGTWGTLIAVPFVVLAQITLSPTAYLAVTLALCVVGVAVCGAAARRLGVHDHPSIVFDEIAGFFITMIAAPAGVWVLLLGFALFRLFDVLKPWPIAWIDRRVHGGFGIMLDDLLAGLAAALCLQAVLWLIAA